MNKQILLRTAIITLVYTIAILFMSEDYSSETIIKVAIQGAVFAVVFGSAIWLLEKWKSKKNKQE